MNPVVAESRARLEPALPSMERPLSVPGLAHPAAKKNTSERGQIIRGSGYSLLARIAMAVSRGVGLVLISRTLGAENFGDYSLLIAAFAISSSVGTLGLDQANVYYSGSRRQSLSLMVRNAIWMAVILGLTTGSGLLLSTHLLRAKIFDTTPPLAELATAIMLPAILHHNYLQGIAIGRSWFRYYSIVEMVKWFVHLAALTILAAVGRLTILTALLALYVPVAVAGLAHLVAIIWGERLSFTHVLGGLPSLSTARQSLAYGARACLLHVTQVFHLRLDVYLVKYFTSASIVGQYALAINIADVILYVGRSAGLAVFARRTCNRDTGAGLAPMVTRVMLVIVGVLTLLVFALREFLVGVFFGAAFLACTTAIACRLPGIVAESMSIVIVSDFLGRARIRAALCINALAVCAGLVLNAIVVPIGGIVAAASVFSVVSWCRIMCLVRVHSAVTGATWIDYLFRFRSNDRKSAWSSRERRRTEEQREQGS